jgi:DNA-binding transcriptional ArsR family regulator
MAGSKRRKKKPRRKKRRKLENHGLIAAMRHPLRRKILQWMADGRKASPNELSKGLGEPLSNVAYHVRELVARGALRPDGERQVRGAREHFYRRSALPAWLRAMLEEDEEQSS